MFLWDRGCTLAAAVTSTFLAYLLDLVSRIYNDLFSFKLSEFYNKAVEVAPNVSDEFDKELSERKCWGLNHLRSYFRAVHGQANTLRKMGRYKESLKKYLLLEKLDPKFYRCCLVNDKLCLLSDLCRGEFPFWNKKGPLSLKGPWCE